jgi:hypothetical protein
MRVVISTRHVRRDSDRNRARRLPFLFERMTTRRSPPRLRRAMRARRGDGRAGRLRPAPQRCRGGRGGALAAPTGWARLQSAEQGAPHRTGWAGPTRCPADAGFDAVVCRGSITSTGPSWRSPRWRASRARTDTWCWRSRTSARWLAGSRASRTTCANARSGARHAAGDATTTCRRTTSRASSSGCCASRRSASSTSRGSRASRSRGGCRPGPGAAGGCPRVSRRPCSQASTRSRSACHRSRT